MLNKILKFLFILLFHVTLFFSVNGQDISYGIKAGLNFSSIKGALETDSNNSSLESLGYVTGFHAGVIFMIPIVDNKFGVSPELLFVQRGGRYKYEGAGSLSLNTTNGSIAPLGTRKEAISIVNSYIDIPVMLYYKPVERLKLALGVDLGFLIASTGNGEIQFTWADLVNQNQTATIELDYNYNRDDIGEVKSTETTSFVIDAGSNSVEYPNVIGAYYLNDTDEGKYFSVFDLGLDADVVFSLTKGIALGFRTTYGLLDITNNKYDYSKQDPSILRADKDHNLSFLVSLGFNF